jgi:dihydroorotase
LRTLIYNARLVDAQRDEPGSLFIRDGIIESIIPGLLDKTALEELKTHEEPESDSELKLLNAQGLTLMPAFIDMHAHFRDPGQLWKEDIASGMSAAAAGGYTTLVLMPNTAPVISSAEQAADVVTRVEALNKGRVFQTVSITKDFAGDDTSHLHALSAQAVPLVTEDGRDPASAAVLLEAMKRCAAKGITVGCHSEDPTLAKAALPLRQQGLELLRNHKPQEAQAAFNSADTLLRAAEDIATERNLRLAETAHCNVHIMHVSTAAAVDSIRQAKKRSSAAPRRSTHSVTCEATPHHLALTASLGQLVNPPLRTEEDRQGLIAAIIDGTVDVIGTDHAPHSADDKQAGAPGFSGLETAFAVCFTALVQTGRISLQKLSSLMSANPASLLGLNQGVILQGKEANLVLVDTETQWTVEPEKFRSKGKNTAFAGQTVTGKVVTTFYRGKSTYSMKNESSSI